MPGSISTTVPTPSEASSDQVNILLVDDSPEKLLAQESILADLGQNLVKVSSGAEALRRLLKEDFAVILLDVNMPHMDGYEVAELIRQRPAYERVPIIFVTSYSNTETDVSRGYALGAVDYITTPIVAQVLRSKVSVFVELAKHRRSLARQAESLATMNQELIRRAEALAQANSELQAFSYSIAHDLRAPLRAMEGLLTALIEDHIKEMSPDGHTYAERISKAARRLDRMIQELLHYSRISLAEMEFKPVRVDAVLTEALAHFEQTLKDNNATVKVKPSHATVLANYTLLQQVVANLLSNAIKFAAPGRPPVVHIWCESLPHTVKLWVEDNGIGIEPSHHERIFRVFERLHGPDDYEGTGIGLAVVQKAVARLEGKVGIAPNEPHGTRFYVELKKAQPM
ncbi:MAG TPA: ATP-binding protein [Methylomirabilota bacterium]|nr:ATP-binding protein [Methylomirabilota bacterium]